MYIKTPKRYRGTRRRSIFSLRRVLFWILAPILIFIGIGLYQTRDMFIPQISAAVEGIYTGVRENVSTAVAPTPLPTADPGDDLASADAFWGQGAIEDALIIYQQVLPLVPNNVDVHYRVTLGLIIEGRYDEAVDMAERTVTANPFHPDAWSIRAMALENAGDFGGAIASANHALELIQRNPNPIQEARAMAFLAEAYLDIGQFTRAQETIAEALDIHPDSPEANRIYGRIVQETQYDFLAAQEAYQRAYALAPYLVYPALDVAWIRYTNGDPERAIEIANEVIQLNPQNTPALFAIGNFYYSGLGNYGRAEEYLRRCVEADPDSILCNYLWGRALLQLERPAEGQEPLQRTVELGTTSARHYYWAGEVEVRLGNCPASLRYFETGYQMALEEGDADLISAFQDRLVTCQSPLGRPTPIPTEDGAESAG